MAHIVNKTRIKRTLVITLLDLKNTLGEVDFNLIPEILNYHLGVLQGGCLSPLLFKLCFNTFIQYVKAEKFRQLGFSPHDNESSFNPVHWFQYAGDATTKLLLTMVPLGKHDYKKG